MQFTIDDLRFTIGGMGHGSANDARRGTKETQRSDIGECSKVEGHGNTSYGSLKKQNPTVRAGARGHVGRDSLV